MLSTRNTLLLSNSMSIVVFNVQKFVHFHSKKTSSNSLFRLEQRQRKDLDDDRNGIDRRYGKKFAHNIVPYISKHVVKHTLCEFLVADANRLELLEHDWHAGCIVKLLETPTRIESCEADLHQPRHSAILQHVHEAQLALRLLSE